MKVRHTYIWNGVEDSEEEVKSEEEMTYEEWWKLASCHGASDILHNVYIEVMNKDNFPTIRINMGDCGSWYEHVHLYQIIEE